MNNNEIEKKLFDPETELLKLSGKKDIKFYIKISKVVMKKFSTVTLSSLGKISEKVIQVSEELVR